MQIDVRSLKDQHLEVIGELALDFPDENVELIERIDGDYNNSDYKEYGLTVSYMLSVGNDLFSVHLSQWQGLSLMMLDDNGYLEFIPTHNQFSIIDYIRNIGSKAG